MKTFGWSWSQDARLAVDGRQRWSAAAQWLELATDDRVVAGSNPTGAAWKLKQVRLPHLASVFRKRH